MLLIQIITLAIWFPDNSKGILGLGGVSCPLVQMPLEELVLTGNGVSDNPELRPDFISAN